MTHLLVFNQVVLMPSQGGLWRKVPFRTVDEFVVLLSKFLPKGARASVFWFSSSLQKEIETHPPMKAKDLWNVLQQRRTGLEESGLSWCVGESKKLDHGGEQVCVYQEAVPFWQVAKERLLRRHRIHLSDVVPWDCVFGLFSTTSKRMQVVLTGDVAQLWVWVKNSHGEIAAVVEEQSGAGWARVRRWLQSEGVSFPESPALPSSVLVLDLGAPFKWTEVCSFWSELSEQNEVKYSSIAAALRKVPKKARCGYRSFLRTSQDGEGARHIIRKIGLVAVAASFALAGFWWSQQSRSRSLHLVSLRRITELRLQIEKRKNAEKEARSLESIYGKGNETTGEPGIVSLLRILGVTTPSFASLDYFDWQQGGALRVAGSVWKLPENDSMEKWLGAYGAAIRKEAPQLVFELKRRESGNRDSQFLLTGQFGKDAK